VNKMKHLKKIIIISALVITSILLLVILEMDIIL